MSRIYVLQEEKIAVAAARMKADVNYRGILDEKIKHQLIDNHVFIRDCWSAGEMHTRRLQLLYHQLMPGDTLFLTDELSIEQCKTAIRYAKERGVLTVLVQLDGESERQLDCEDGNDDKVSGSSKTEQNDGSAHKAPSVAGDSSQVISDIVICYKQDEVGKKNNDQPAANLHGTERIVLTTEENIFALCGALSLCLLNGLRGEKAAKFYRKAAKFKELPWYDEVAYS